MGKKSYLDKITGKKAPAAVVSDPVDVELVEGGVDLLWIKGDIDAKKPKLEKNPKIDTGILRGRIADKIAKMNNN
jgi:hypothetical protein